MFAAFGRVSPNYYCGITNYHTMCRLVFLFSTLLKKGSGIKKVNTVQNKDYLEIAKFEFFGFLLLCLFPTVIRLLLPMDNLILYQSCFYSAYYPIKTSKA